MKQFDLKESQILEQWLYKDKVYISCISTVYNHGDFVIDMINGVLSQKTVYRFELVIHDDDSDDETKRILTAYQKKYPNIIRLIMQNENQYSKSPVIPFLTLMEEVRGDYVAICEGDDYWNYENKIEEQFCFLKNNKNYVLHVFDANAIDDQNNELYSSKQMELGIECGTYEKDHLKMNFVFLTLSSMFVKSAISHFPNYFSGTVNLDSAVQLLLSMNGKAYVDRKSVATYRINHGGVWGLLDPDMKFANILNRNTMRYKFFIDKGLSDNAGEQLRIILLMVIKKVGISRFFKIFLSVLIKGLK